MFLAVAAIGALAWATRANASINQDAAAPAPADTPSAGFADNLLSALGVEAKKIINWQPPATAAPYLEQIAAAEQAHGLPQGLLVRQLYQESRFRPDIITGATKSPVGALGIAQFMPGTAHDLGVDPLNPADAIDGAARYMKGLFASLGSWPEALAAYNWGIGNVRRKGIDAAPLETQNYVDQIVADVATL